MNYYIKQGVFLRDGTAEGLDGLSHHAIVHDGIKQGPVAVMEKNREDYWWLLLCPGCQNIHIDS